MNHQRPFSAVLWIVITLFAVFLPLKQASAIISQNMSFPVIPNQTLLNLKTKAAISTGTRHSLFLKADGSVWASGENSFGQLGTGGFSSTITPVLVIPGGVKAIATGEFHSLFLKSDGSVWACGRSDSGQLGNGSDIGSQVTPIRVMGGIRAIAAAGSHSFFLKTDGVLLACGQNDSGQLATGSIDFQLKPFPILGRVVAVATNRSHSLFVQSDGSALASGSNFNGQLGTTTELPDGYSDTPVFVTQNVLAVAAGANHSLFLKTDGAVHASGSNQFGQLGIGNAQSQSVPTQVITGVSAISAGDSHSLFITNDGFVWGCGRNSNGQIGPPTSGSSIIPAKIFANVAAISAAGDSSLFLKTDGTVFAKGENFSGQLGINQTGSLFTPLLVLRTVTLNRLVLAATVTSGITVTYTLVSGPATLNGNVLTFEGAGPVTVTANAAGNATYAPAQISRTFTVFKSPQRVDVTPVRNQVYATSPFPIIARSSSGLPVTLTVVSGNATISDHLVTLTGLGNVTIMASQTGDALYAPAPNVSLTFNVAPNTSAPTAISLSPTWFYDNVTPQTLVSTAMAIDPDAGDRITYTLVSGDGSTDNYRFRIVDGGLKTALPFNYNLRKSHSIRIRATDLAGQFLEMPFTIDLVDATPFANFNFKSGFTTGYPENDPTFLVPSYVNVIFQLTDQFDAGINLPKALLDQNDDVFTVQEDSTNISTSEAIPLVNKIDEIPAKIRTILLIDTSFSVRDRLGEIREAAKKLVDGMVEKQEIAIYTFSGGPTMIRDFTPKTEANQVALKAAIDSIKLGNNTTNLYGSMLAMLNLPKWRESFSTDGIETGYLVVLTDGSDTSGQATEDQVVIKRNADNKKIYAIGLASSELNVDTLRTMSRGQYTPVDDIDQLGAAFENIQKNIINNANSYYWLNYISPKRGDFDRKLTITLKNNENFGSNSGLTVGFNSNRFTDVESELTIDRKVNAVRGVQHLTLPKTATFTTEAYTIYPPIGDPSYIWKIADPSLATILPSGDSGDTLSIRAKNIDGTTTLTVTDPVNRYTKTIPVTFGIPTLAGLDLSSGSYSPKFNPRTTTYTAKVPNRVTSLSITPKAVALSQITVKGKQVAPGTPSNAIPLKVGANVITVVMAVPGTTLTRTYTITVTRAPSAVATLDDLGISGFALSPEFRSGKLNYVSQVPGKTKALKIRATATSPVARIQINGKTVQSGKLSKPIGLKSGKTTLSIVVTAQSGARKTYRITVNRLDSKLRWTKAKPGRLDNGIRPARIAATFRSFMRTEAFNPMWNSSIREFPGIEVQPLATAAAAALNPGIFADWQTLHWPLEVDAEMIGPDADPDADGLNNLLEWALALDPNVPGAFTPELTLNEGVLRYQYSRRKLSGQEATVLLEWSDSPGAGWSGEGVNTEHLGDIDDFTESVRSSIPAGDAGRRFLRLKIVRP